jgi:hypothetical protein
MARFQPGTSGNPKGRPKGSRNLATEFLTQIQEEVKAKPGKPALSKLQAAIKAQLDKAVAGDNRAIEAVLARVAQLEARVTDAAAHAPPPSPFTAADREVIAEIHRRLTGNAAAQGISQGDTP